MARVYLSDKDVIGKKIRAITFPSGYIHIDLEDDLVIELQEEEYTIYYEEVKDERPSVKEQKG